MIGATPRLPTTSAQTPPHSRPRHGPPGKPAARAAPGQRRRKKAGFARKNLGFTLPAARHGTAALSQPPPEPRGLKVPIGPAGRAAEALAR